MSAASIRMEILAERRRQVTAEGYTAQNDDRYRRGVLARAGQAYMEHACGQPVGPRGTPLCWPWPAPAWKPKDPRRDAVRAGALFLAEQDRERRTRSLSDFNRHRAIGQMDRALKAVVALIQKLDEIEALRQGGDL